MDKSLVILGHLFNSTRQNFVSQMTKLSLQLWIPTG
jgi:hypothetical protein